MQVSISGQLPEEAPVGPQGSYLALCPVVGFVVQAGDAVFFQALGFKCLDLFFPVSKQGPCFTAIEEDGGNKRLAQIEVAWEADGVAAPDTVVWVLLPCTGLLPGT